MHILFIIFSRSVLCSFCCVSQFITDPSVVTLQVQSEKLLSQLKVKGHDAEPIRLLGHVEGEKPPRNKMAAGLRLAGLHLAEGKLRHGGGGMMMWAFLGFSVQTPAECLVLVEMG